MVAHLLRLKLTLLRNGFRRSPWQLAGIIIGGLYALGIVATGVTGLLVLRQAEIGIAQTVVVVGGAAAVLGWAVVPIVASAADMTLDPSRFTTFTIPMPQLLTGLALAGLIGIPGAATALVALATVGTWWRGILPASGALAGAVLGTLTCVLLSKVVTAATAGLAGSRRFRDVSYIALLIPLVLMGPILAGVARGITGSAGFVAELARVLAWTPAGAAWALGGELAAGQYAAAAAKLLVALASLAGLAWCWKVLLQHALVTAPHAGAAKKQARGLGLFRRFPATPAGAIAARSLTYWVRDPRYAGALVVVPLLPVLLFFQASQTRFYGILEFVGPLAAFLLAWSISSDVSYDSTAFALHVAAGVRGVHDRLGRAAACLVFALPVVVAFSVLPLLITGQWTLLPAILGLSLGVLFSGLGLSSVVSARYTMPVPLPGDSPFKKPPGNVAQTLAVQFGGMAVLLVLVSPELILVALQLAGGSVLPGWICLVLGPGAGFRRVGRRGADGRPMVRCPEP